MPALTRSRALAFVEVMLGAYVLGFVLFGLALGFHSYGLISAALAVLAAGMTTSFVLKFLAINAAQMSQGRKVLSGLLWALPAIAFWALAIQQLRG